VAEPPQQMVAMLVDKLMAELGAAAGNLQPRFLL
jgi:flagellin-specific chaperone FliS